MTRFVFVGLLLFVGFAFAVAQDVVLPKDVVELRCVEEPALNGEYTVTEAGHIQLQFIGAVEIKGLTPQAAAAKISRELVSQQILQKATVTLRIKAEARPDVTVAGAVSRGGRVPWKTGMRLSDALDWGVPTSVADLAKIRITSLAGQVKTVDRVATSANPDLEPGDQVFVPLKGGDKDVTVLGAVARPGVYPFEAGMSISDAVQAAGGYRADADPNRITVKFAGGQQRVLDMNLPENNIVLSAGDSVVVPQKSADQQVYVRGAISRPGLLTFRAGMTVSQVVRDAVPVEGARLDRVKILRKDAAGKTQTIAVNLAKIMQGQTPDEPLIIGDIVEVPYPGKSFGMREGLQVASLVLLLLWLLKK